MTATCSHKSSTHWAVQMLWFLPGQWKLFLVRPGMAQILATSLGAEVMFWLDGLIFLLICHWCVKFAWWAVNGMLRSWWIPCCLSGQARERMYSDCFPDTMGSHAWKLNYQWPSLFPVGSSSSQATSWGSRMITCQFFTFMRGIASEQEDIAKSHKLAAMRSLVWTMLDKHLQPNQFTIQVQVETWCSQGSGPIASRQPIQGQCFHLSMGWMMVEKDHGQTAGTVVSICQGATGQLMSMASRCVSCHMSFTRIGVSSFKAAWCTSFDQFARTKTVHVVPNDRPPWRKSSALSPRNSFWQFVMHPGRSVSIGRGSDCDVTLPFRGVSVHHALLHFRPESWVEMGNRWQ